MLLTRPVCGRTVFRAAILALGCLALSHEVVRALGRTAGFDVTVSADASVISNAVSAATTPCSSTRAANCR